MRFDVKHSVLIVSIIILAYIFFLTFVICASTLAFFLFNCYHYINTLIGFPEQHPVRLPREQERVVSEGYKK